MYTRAGWQLVAGPTSFSQPEARATYPEVTMVLALGGDVWPAGEIDLRGLSW